MKSFRVLVFLAAALAVLSCPQPSNVEVGPVEAGDLGAALFLAKTADASSPEDHFFFLPPLAPAPEYSGTFAADLEPVVRVGILTGDTLTPVAEFTTGGRASERVRLDYSDNLGDFYIVNLHLQRFAIPVYSCLLIQVFVDGEKIGEIAAVTVPDGSEKDAVENGVPLVAKRTVPIKFRIEEEYFDRIKMGSIEVWKPAAAAAELLDVPPYDDFIAVAAGTHHATGLRADGSLVSWGQDTQGQVSGTPTGSGYVAVDAGLLYSMALHADGTVVAWGGGLAATDDCPSGSGFKAIGAGFAFAYGITDAGELHQWGPMTGMPAGTGFVQVRASRQAAAALDSAGAPTIFGTNTGIVGTAVPAGTFTTVDIGDYNAAGVLDDGSLVSWGGTSAVAYGLVQDFSDGPYIAVAAGERLGLGLRKDGTLKAYGTQLIAADIPADADGYFAVAVSPIDTAFAIREAAE